MLIILKQAEAELGQAQVCKGFIQKYKKQDDLLKGLFDELQGVLINTNRAKGRGANTHLFLSNFPFKL